MAMGHCKLCGQEKPLIRAHLVPHGLVNRLLSSSGDDRFEGIDFNTGQRKTLQTLEVDNTILCAECDNGIGVLDNCLLKFIDRWRALPEREETDPAVSAQVETNTEQLALAVAAVILRFSFTKRYSLGLGSTYEPLVSNWVRNRKLPPNFGRWISVKVVGFKKYTQLTPEGKLIDMTEVSRQHPSFYKRGSLRYYSLDYLGLTFLFKASQSGWPELAKRIPEVDPTKDYVDVPLLPGVKYRTAQDGFSLPAKNDRYIANRKAMKANQSRG